MQSLWSDSEAQSYGDDPLSLRVYTSRLLGRDPALVLHGGGNTSVKATAPNFFGDPEDLIYVKGSGWDLATIEAAGFAPVRISVLLQLATLPSISDTDLVRIQRSAMTDPTAPDPSVEAVLHALIPATFVDHTHSDAVVALTNNPHGPDLVAEVYGDRVLVVPYVMPGFTLARTVYEMTQGIDWAAYEGMILLNHGVFTWGDTARDAYESMIRLVSLAEDHLRGRTAFEAPVVGFPAPDDLIGLARLREAVTAAAGFPIIVRLNDSPEAVGFSNLSDLAAISQQGPLTPDHIIRTKRVPLIVSSDPAVDVQRYTDDYRAYFERHNSGALTMLDPAPRWAIWPGHGILTFDRTLKAADIIMDIAEHTITAMQWTSVLGGWQSLPEKDLFEVEYWELEQVKLKKAGKRPPMEGKIALVTGAASGIGKAIAIELGAQGAAVLALDINPACVDTFNTPSMVGIECDATKPEMVCAAVEEAIRMFGGLDILVSNAGLFPGSQSIEAMDAPTWDKTLELNLTSHQRIIQACVPFMRHGINPSIIVVGSKNVPAPGPGQAAYSVSKAGVTQLARVAAMELAKDGIRVNVVHPNAVFDTGIWTEGVLESRAKAYGMTVDEYKKNNLLGVEVTSKDVAALIAAIAGPAFAKTTGAQIPIDGGNDRVI
jgi:rhamnose utilization protein RhaD (predicted bifunctional aldolase and dehydrogenase)/NAD(P)-dependent dehydrogenase (short-subunit alcohol dehydrogenase family)